MSSRQAGAAWRIDASMHAQPCPPYAAEGLADAATGPCYELAVVREGECRRLQARVPQPRRAFTRGRRLGCEGKCL